MFSYAAGCVFSAANRVPHRAQVTSMPDELRRFRFSGRWRSRLNVKQLGHWAPSWTAGLTLCVG